MPVWTKDLDQAIAEVIGTLDGVEEKTVGLREDIVIIFKGSTGYMENHCCSSYYLAYAVCKWGR